MKINSIKNSIFDLRYKNIKLFYFTKNYVIYAYLKLKLHKIPFLLKQAQTALLENNDILSRVNYYNKIDTSFELPNNATLLDDFKYRKKQKTYFFDTYSITHHFNKNLKFSFIFGDITDAPPTPSIVKSRPINNHNQNAVLLNLNKVRHFVFVKDPIQFTDKEFKLIWRGNIKNHQPHRIKFIEQFYTHELCDIGCVNNFEEGRYDKPKLAILEHLKFKFILCIEGNDVATNLKWVMSSNSIAVMPKPKYETWFMEGRLIPNVHYIEIKEDYSDLDERLNYYNNHPKAAEEIIKNAHAHVRQFRNKRQEKIISLLVLQKYFKRSKQEI